jgi:large subunit ribosomal protein L2
VPAKVAAIEYDPNRTARIALLHYADGEKRYILAPRAAAGDTVSPARTPRFARQRPAAAQHPGRHHRPQRRADAGPAAKMARSAGASVQLVAKEGRFATLRLPSGEMRNVLADCRATVGEVGNAEHANITLGKAGRCAGRASRPRPRCRHEPGRPPARWWRGSSHAGRAPGDTVGRSDAWLPHAQEAQGVRPPDRSWSSSRAQEGR